MFAICGTTPSCINHCVCRGKPFTTNGGKKSFGSIALITHSLLFHSKRLGRLSCGWTWQPKQWLSLCDYFSMKVLMRFHPPKPGSICSQSHVNENRPRPKTVCLKEFNVLLLPRMETEVTWICHWLKAYSPQQFCMGDFPFLSKYYLYVLLRLSTHLSCLPCWFARAVLAQLQDNAQLEHADTLFLQTHLPLQAFWKSTV